MCDAEKPEEPVRRDAIDVRRRQLRRACCQGSIPCAPPKIPMGLLSGKHMMCGAEKSEGPVLGETYDVRHRQLNREFRDKRLEIYILASCRVSHSIN